MPSYLLTWNPRRFGSWDELYWLSKEPQSRWSCGSRQSMEKRSRVYLFKQGIEPRGIVASGYTTSDVYQDRHWDPKRRRKREKANYVEVRFDVVLGEDAQSVFAAHQIKALRSVYWRTQMSGIRIPDGVAKELERLWQRFAKLEKQAVIERTAEAVENRLKEITTYARSRDRRLRDEALLRSEGICTGCEVNFWEFPDGLGRPVLQVHHRKQLASSNRPRITRLNDLAVLCANCHAMLNENSKRPLSVELLRRRLRQMRA